MIPDDHGGEECSIPKNSRCIRLDGLKGHHVRHCVPGPPMNRSEASGCNIIIYIFNTIDP